MPYEKGKKMNINIQAYKFKQVTNCFKSRQDGISFNDQVQKIIKNKLKLFYICAALTLTSCDKPETKYNQYNDVADVTDENTVDSDTSSWMISDSNIADKENVDSSELLSRFEELETKLNEIETRLADSEKKNEEFESKNKEIESDIDDLERDVSSLESKYSYIRY
jgi:chromosome segregation ATPase